MSTRQTHIVLGIVLGVAIMACGPTPPQPANGIVQLVAPARASALEKIAAEEEAAGTIDRRRAVVVDLNRQVLMAPPADALVPELFDLVIAMTPRMEAGEISPAWAAYVYTSYQRDLLRDRPAGTPRRAEPEIQATVKDYVDYFRLHFRPGGLFDPAAAAMEDTQGWRTERRLGR